jgi:hypothetical protein
MTVKLMIYAVAMAATFYLHRQHNVFSAWPFPEHVALGYLTITYVGLLYLQVRAGVQRNETQSRLQWTGFAFTTGVGIMWAFVISIHRGTWPMLEAPAMFLGFLVGYVAFGALMGIPGAVLTLLMLKFLFRREVL